MSSSAKRQVQQRLHDMGFSHNDIRAAVAECGYNTEACADWIVSRKHDKKPRLFVGMEVWIFSSDDNDWCPGNVVSITKQLLSIIFNGNDFRWLEKESDVYRIQDEKPLPSSSRHHNSAAGAGRHSNHNARSLHGDDAADDPYGAHAQQDGMQQEYAPPRPDEADYYVTFTESVLGLELYSDEDGFNCIVGRCVSTIARNKVTPGSQIVQVNERWLANYRFEEIRDAVKQAARQPPLAVTFRIKKALLRRPQSASNGQNQQNQAPPPPQDASGASKPDGVPNTANLFSAASPYNGYQDASASATSPDTPNNQQAGSHKLSAPAPPNRHSAEEKRSQPQLHSGNAGADAEREAEAMGPLSFAACDALQIGDHVDHRDDVGRFLLATIVDREAYRVKIHYEGWNSKWDTWCDFKAETHRFARPRSVSRRPNTRFRDLKIRDYVDINPVQRHLGWRVGQIRRMDKYSGQAQIVYKEEGQEFLYWAHLNNPREIAPFMTRAAETIALQQKIAEFNHDEHQHQGVQAQLQGGDQHQPHEDVGSPEDMSGNVSMNPLHGHGHALRASTVNTMNTGSSQAPQQQQAYGHSQQHNGAGSQLHPQPPSAHGLGMSPHQQPMGQMQKQSSAAAKRESQSQHSERPRGATHQKSRSRVLPKTIKNKKLPPKPAKSPKKRKNVNRSRTQPLPDNHQHQAQPHSNGYANANGYANQNGYAAQAMQAQAMQAQPQGQAMQHSSSMANGYAMPQQQQYAAQQRAASSAQYLPHQQPAMKPGGYTAQW